MNPIRAMATALALGLTLTACDRAPAGEARSSAATSSGPAPSAVAVTPAPSDAKDPAFTAPAAKQAGSAIGGTAGGNTTDPQSSTPKGEPIAPGKPAEPTGGDGTPQGEPKATK